MCTKRHKQTVIYACPHASMYLILSTHMPSTGSLQRRSGEKLSSSMFGVFGNYGIDFGHAANNDEIGHKNQFSCK